MSELLYVVSSQPMAAILGRTRRQVNAKGGVSNRPPLLLAHPPTARAFALAGW